MSIGGSNAGEAGTGQRRGCGTFSSIGSMWKELRTTSGVAMCCHVTYDCVAVFHTEKSSRYRLLPISASTPRRFASDGGLVSTVISVNASRCSPSRGLIERVWPRSPSGISEPVAACKRQPWTSYSLPASATAGWGWACERRSRGPWGRLRGGRRGRWQRKTCAPASGGAGRAAAPGWACREAGAATFAQRGKTGVRGGGCVPVLELPPTVETTGEGCSDFFQTCSV